jgi:RNA polymerase sigma-70 factor (ECF subfamily)
VAIISSLSNIATEADKLKAYKQTGNMQILAELYSPCMDSVYGVCMKYLENAEDAQDAVINIFEELIEKLKKYEIENFGGWLYQLSRNHCLMKLRKEKSRPRVVELPVMHFAEEQHLDSVLEKEKNLNQLEECLQQLNEEQRQAVSMFYLQDKCYKEIEETTGLELNKVRSFIQNGRRNLKICMEEKANGQS